MVDVILGLQWGDEGKGKIVDVLTAQYDAIARFQGGPNAGHTLEFEGKKIVLHTIPSGIFHNNALNIIGNGVVLDPIILVKELANAQAQGADPKKNLKISKKAHLILPTHRQLDAASEAAKGKDKIGSTLKGIGPTYMDKTGRNGLRIGDILSNDFEARYTKLKEKHLGMFKMYNYEPDLSLEAEWFAAIEQLKAYEFIDSEYEINYILDQNKSILAEGAQGTLLDIDFGNYPFVTSSNTTSAGVCSGLGVPPTKVRKVMGIFKAYCTRVGSGPFPTELFDETGEHIRQQGHEFGSTTGRPRRTGWLDLVALKYAIMINGVTELFMMKGDVLNQMDSIQVAVAYKVDGKITYRFPYDPCAEIEPMYREFKGWKTDIRKCRKEEELPQEMLEYIRFIESELGVPVTVVSVGPDRVETIFRNKAE